MSAQERKVLSLNKNKANRHQAIRERLHKVLANAGLGSRRALEQRIRDGEVTVNDDTAEIGCSVSTGDRVRLDQRQYVVTTDHGEDVKVLAYNKPEGEITTRDDPEQRATVFDKLDDPDGQRWISIGRLDINTSGLLLLTTEGELANALMHPSGEVEREYLCRIHGDVDDNVLQRLSSGVELEDGKAHFDQIIALEKTSGHAWFRVVLREGRNREVRRMWQAVGLEVSRLKRIRYGCISLPRRLRRGDSLALDAGDIQALRKLVGMKAPARTLTLKPVSGQRRATTQVKAPKTQGGAWVGGARSEAHELGAHDRPGPRRGKRDSGFRPRRHKDIEGSQSAPYGATRKRGNSRRKAAPGEELPSVRSWFAGDDRRGGKNKGGSKRPSSDRRGGRGKGPGKGRGPR